MITLEARRAARRVAWIGLVTTLAAASGCAPRAMKPRPGEAPYDRLLSIRFESGKPVAWSVTDLPASIHRKGQAKTSPPPRPKSMPRVHPLLTQWLADSLAQNPVVSLV